MSHALEGHLEHRLQGHAGHPTGTASDRTRRAPPAIGASGAARVVATDDIAALDRVVDCILGAAALLQATAAAVGGDAGDLVIDELDRALDELREAVACGAGQRRAPLRQERLRH